MSFLIQAEVSNLDYWVKFLDKHYVYWELAGLKNNGTGFDTRAEAERLMDTLKTKLDLKVIEYKQ